MNYPDYPMPCFFRPVPWFPTDMAGITIWLRADSGVTQIGDQVSSWVDQKSSVAYTQSNGVLKPTYVASVINGQPALGNLVNSTVCLDAGDLSALFPTAATLYIIYRAAHLVADAGACAYETKASGDSYWRYGGNDGYISAFRIDRLNGITISAPYTGDHCVKIESTASSWKFWVDNDLKTTQGASYSGGVYHRLFASDYLTTPRNFLKGYIAEVVGLNQVAVVGDETSFYTYINTRYGI